MQRGPVKKTEDIITKCTDDTRNNKKRYKKQGNLRSHFIFFCQDVDQATSPIPTFLNISREIIPNIKYMKINGYYELQPNVKQE
jgi:hypothetical protein